MSQECCHDHAGSSVVDCIVKCVVLDITIAGAFLNDNDTMRELLSIAATPVNVLCESCVEIGSRQFVLMHLASLQRIGSSLTGDVKNSRGKNEHGAQYLCI